MSGIIGGAGSKSGVIGETELDYEEGTWTPTSLAGGTVSITANHCRYVKIGKTCVINAHISNIGASGSSQQIGGFPFTCATNIYPTFSVQSNANPPSGIVGRLSPNSTGPMYFFDNNTSTGQAYVTGDSLDGGHLMFSGVYQIA